MIRNSADRASPPRLTRKLTKKQKREASQARKKLEARAAKGWFTYEVEVRRDVQQLAKVRVEARTPQEAIETAEAVADEAEWRVEEHIGSHKSKAQRIAQETP